MIKGIKKSFTFLIIAFFTYNVQANQLVCEDCVFYKELSIVPTFNPIDPICLGSKVTPLPLISLNGIVGTWSPSSIDNTVTTVYTFTPDVGQDAENTSLTIIVIPITTTTIFCELILPTVLRIDWAPIGSNHYDYSYSIDGGTPVVGSTFVSNFEIPNFLTGQSIVFTLTNVEGVFCFQPISTTCGTLKNSDFNRQQFDYFPNPVVDFLNINSNFTITHVGIFNLIGQQIFSDYCNSKSLHLNMIDFKSGLYIFKIYSESGTTNFKVLKN